VSKKNFYYQQGDVLINSTGAIPSGAKPVKPTAKGYVFREGEATGHAHRVADVDAIEMFEENGTIFVKVKRKADLSHEEHKTITLDPGTYEIDAINEVDHDEDEIRKVRD